MRVLYWKRRLAEKNYKVNGKGFESATATYGFFRCVSGIVVAVKIFVFPILIIM